MGTDRASTSDVTARLPAWLSVDVRPGPSANVVLVRGARGAVLVDAGAGTRSSDALLDAFLAGHGLAPGDLDLVVTTHWHPDHVGGVARLQRDHGVPVAALAAEAELIDAGDPRAFDSPRLEWHITPYRVDRHLRDGDVVGDAGVALHVVATPGQTPGHLALWEPAARVLVTGDLLQAGDVGWMPIGGPWADGAADTLLASVRRLGALGARVGVPGHGPPVTDVEDAVRRSVERYTRWREEPEHAGWHAARRAFVSLAMLEDVEAATVEQRYATRAWVVDLAAVAGIQPRAVVARLVADLTGSGALAMRDGLLVPARPYEGR